MLATLAVANVVSFGNGSVMVAVLRDSFVADAGALSTDQLLYAFALARVTPGQANLYVASIGYMMFGLPGAVLSIVVIALPGYLMIPLMRGYERLRGMVVVARFARGVAATAVGLILAIGVGFGRDALDAPVAWGVLLLALGLMLFSKLPTLASLLLAATAGVAAVLLLGPLATGQPALG